MKILGLPVLPCLVILTVIAIASVDAQSVGPTSAALNTTVPLSNFFWQLGDLETWKPPRSPYLGGQNMTICCLKAVNESLQVSSDGTLKNVTNWISASISQLQGNYSKGQFPCDAQYNGDSAGAPLVQVPYVWLADTCPGWELSSKTNLNAWLQPLSGFLIPAVPLIFSIPRRRKVEVNREFFMADLSGVKSYLAAPFGAAGALLIVMLDTIIWLSTCLAFAAPMILSGLYEAMLDKRMLDFLKERVENERLTLDMRARCLMTILIGNLDLGLKSSTSREYQPLASGVTNPYHSPVIEGKPIEPQGYHLYDEVDSPNRQEVSVDQFQKYEYQPTQPVPTIGVEEPSQPDEIIPLANYEEYSSPRASTSMPDPHHQSIPPTKTFSTYKTPSSEHLYAPSSVHSRKSLSPEVRQSVASSKLIAHMVTSPWRHMEKLLYDIRLYDDEDSERGETPRQYPRHECNNSACEDLNHNEKPRVRDAAFKSHVAKTRTRLRSMLQCQSSFGSVVGAPVIFFIGGFIFSFMSSLENLGLEDIAEALAFGQLYMIIPHIAIVTGLLLAGNNPNILEGVIAPEAGHEEQEEEKKGENSFLGLRFGLAFPSCYRTAWQWRRGHVKKTWFNKIIETYLYRKDSSSSPGYPGAVDRDMVRLMEKTTLGPLDWFFIIFTTGLLVYVPFTLAFLTSYFTPSIGLSCRSLTSSVWACSQAGQALLWLWDNVGPPRAAASTKRGARGERRFRLLDFTREGGWLARSGFYSPSTLNWPAAAGHYDNNNNNNNNNNWAQNPRGSRQMRLPKVLWCSIYYFFTAAFGAGAVFSMIGGTLMQLLGVYSANICSVTAVWWLSPFDVRPNVTLSLNTHDMITSAENYWKPCAITAIVFMAVVSFVGWWYQRRMRDVFSQMVQDIDNSNFDRDDTRRARPLSERWQGDLSSVRYE
ncbi:hypothetical protein BX600DRAFT_534925 [Xylariales sp. PMI_506]|nr:hypothetical protein BX600DRAFT_534925 [Xylariales sp. PMI_506]